MTFQLEPMTEEDARTLCGWRYPAPYDVYRWPSWEKMMEEGREFTDPGIRSSQYLSVRSVTEELAAYVQLFPLDRTTRLGLSLRPDLCGLGFGGDIVRLALGEAIRRRPEAEIDLEVETWNRRAIRTYEKSGFVPADEYDKRAVQRTVRVLCMVWNPKERNNRTWPDIQL